MSGRLSLAFERGVVAVPDGDVFVVGAGVDAQFDGLAPSSLKVLGRFADIDAGLRRRGLDVYADLPDHASSAIVILPRARSAQRAYVKAARRVTAGPIIVDGDKTNGVDAFYRELRERADLSEAWSKAHGKVFSVQGGDFADWPDFTPQMDADGWWRAPGVFSADGVDKASSLLASLLPPSLSGEVVDLGAGWGFLTREVLGRDGVQGITLIENDSFALAAARRNIDDPRAHFVHADANSWRPGAPVDHVITNPPFHTGRAANPELGQSFIRAAAEMLKPKSSLWLVANRQLPYEKVLESTFNSVKPLGNHPSFKVFHATSPKRRPKG